MVVMNALLFKLLMLVSTLHLALPSGWCCVASARQVEAEAEAPKPGCCCHTEQETPGEKPASLPPARQCCQPVVSTPAPEPTQTHPDLTVTSALVLPEAAAALPVVVALANQQVIVTSPPLHVFLCVWRC